MPTRPTTHKCDIPRTSKGGIYRMKKWRGIRARHIARNPVCPCGKIATEVDHVDGDIANNVSTNLQSYCKSCHSKKTVRCDGGLGRVAE